MCLPFGLTPLRIPTLVKQDVVIRQAPLKENRYITRMYLHDVNLVKIENGIQSFTNPALGLQGVRPIESLNQNIADSQDNSSGSTQFSRQLNDVATHTSDSDGQPLTFDTPPNSDPRQT